MSVANQTNTHLSYTPNNFNRPCADVGDRTLPLGRETGHRHFSRSHSRPHTQYHTGLTGSRVPPPVSTPPRGVPGVSPLLYEEKSIYRGGGLRLPSFTTKISTDSYKAVGSTSPPQTDTPTPSLTDKPCLFWCSRSHVKNQDVPTPARGQDLVLSTRLLVLVTEQSLPESRDTILLSRGTSKRRN